MQVCLDGYTVTLYLYVPVLQYTVEATEAFWPKTKSLFGSTCSMCMVQNWELRTPFLCNQQRHKKSLLPSPPYSWLVLNIGSNSKFYACYTFLILVNGGKSDLELKLIALTYALTTDFARNCDDFFKWVYARNAFCRNRIQAQNFIKCIICTVVSQKQT